jgi:hypothetical protein
MPHEFSTDYVRDSIAIFRQYKSLAEKAMAQISDEEFFRAIDPESNSIAIIVKHMTGNMRSRWRDFLNTDGEKPDRNRDGEFELEPNVTRAELMKIWERDWQVVFDALAPLSNADLERKVMIRGEPHSVMQAINRQVAHYANHIGQIIFLAKHFRSSEFKSVTIPRNRSKDFEAAVRQGKVSQR